MEKGRARCSTRTCGGGAIPPPGHADGRRRAYSQGVGALTASLLRRRDRETARRAGTTFRFVCYLDRLPPHVLEEDGYRTRATKSPEVEVELEAEDFAGAVAEAIRVLEVDLAHVEAIERL
jgi:hypothetical protein